MAREPLEIPVISRPAEDLANLAAAINGEHAAGEASIERGLEHFRRAGEFLIRAKAQHPHGSWLAWLKKNVRFAESTAQQYMRLARNMAKSVPGTDLNLHETARKNAVRAVQESLPGVNGEEEEAETAEADAPKFITLERWAGMGADARRRALAPPDTDERFNDQGDSESIAWALWSWNPVTGCRHNCPYCYARDIANRLFEPGFVPSFWPGRLNAPRNTPFPADKAAHKAAHKNVFVCSMADLFGRWVPKEWVDAVLGVCAAAPQWTFLFLTKFPVRMAEFDFPGNAWVGTTVDCQARVANAERSFRKVNAPVKWLSCEPLLEPLEFTDIGAFNWVVLGGASASTQTPEWRPPRGWVEQIKTAAAAAGCKVYEKSNLIRLTQELPWAENEPAPTEAPAALRYLPTDGTVANEKADGR